MYLSSTQVQKISSRRDEIFLCLVFVKILCYKTAIIPYYLEIMAKEKFNRAEQAYVKEFGHTPREDGYVNMTTWRDDVMFSKNDEIRDSFITCQTTIRHAYIRAAAFGIFTALAVIVFFVYEAIKYHQIVERHALIWLGILITICVVGLIANYACYRTCQKFTPIFTGDQKLLFYNGEEFKTIEFDD